MSELGEPFLRSSGHDVFTAAGHDFTLNVFLDADGVSIRIRRSPGTGLPLYETSTLRLHEADALVKLLKQALS